MGKALEGQAGLLVVAWRCCAIAACLDSTASINNMLLVCCALQDINEFLTNELKARSVATTQVH
jgi:hypothetical protein